MEQERKLRIISLDESGEFERFLSDDIRFIGGLIIDKPLPENAKTDNIVANVRKEIRSELTRLTEEYNRLLEEKGFLFEDKEVIVKYPESLHMSDSNTYYSKDGVGIKKAKLEKKLRAEEIQPFSMWMKERSMEFIKEMGYGIYAYIYPFGDNFINVEGVESNLGAADYASHLYSRMSTVSMFNTVFYMFDDSFTDYSLQFAQRSLVFSGLTNDREREVNQGLSKEYAKHIVVEKGPNDREKKSTIYTITNVSSYRTSLTDEIYGSELTGGYKNKSYYLGVDSIDYSGKKDMAIHYLTDILCSHIRNTIDRLNSKNEIYNDTAELIQQELGAEVGDSTVDIRFYSKADADFRKIYRHIMLGDLAKAFDAEFDFSLVSRSVDESDDADYVRENILSKYYEQEFAPRLDAYIESLLVDEKYYSDIISRYDEYVSYAERFMGKDGNLGYNRGLHIAERLIAIYKVTTDGIEGLYKMQHSAYGMDGGGSIEVLDFNNELLEEYRYGDLGDNPHPLEYFMDEYNQAVTNIGFPELTNEDKFALVMQGVLGEGKSWNIHWKCNTHLAEGDNSVSLELTENSIVSANWREWELAAPVAEEATSTDAAGTVSFDTPSQSVEEDEARYSAFFTNNYAEFDDSMYLSANGIAVRYAYADLDKDGLDEMLIGDNEGVYAVITEVAGAYNISKVCGWRVQYGATPCEYLGGGCFVGDASNGNNYGGEFMIDYLLKYNGALHDCGVLARLSSSWDPNSVGDNLNNWELYVANDENSLLSRDESFDSSNTSYTYSYIDYGKNYNFVDGELESNDLMDQFNSLVAQHTGEGALESLTWYELQ